MEKFPESFTLINLMKTIEKEQANMTLQVRKQFYDEIVKAANNSEPSVKLTFPKNHWPVNKIKIAKELLEIFGEFTTYTYQKKSNATVDKTITEEADLSKNINSIVIHFMQEND